MHAHRTPTRIPWGEQHEREEKNIYKSLIKPYHLWHLFRARKCIQCISLRLADHPTVACCAVSCVFPFRVCTIEIKDMRKVQVSQQIWLRIQTDSASQTINKECEKDAKKHLRHRHRHHQKHIQKNVTTANFSFFLRSFAHSFGTAHTHSSHS